MERAREEVGIFEEEKEERERERGTVGLSAVVVVVVVHVPWGRLLFLLRVHLLSLLSKRFKIERDGCFTMAIGRGPDEACCFE